MSIPLADGIECAFGDGFELSVTSAGVVIERVRGGMAEVSLELSPVDARRLVELLSFSLRAVEVTQ